MNILRKQFLHPAKSKHNLLTRIAANTMRAVITLAVACVFLDNLDQRKEVRKQQAIVADKKEVIRQLALVLDGHAVLVDGSYERAVVTRRIRPVIKDMPQVM